MKTRMRAFIGPLGDDIPSLFPIIVGVVLFLGAMYFAVNLTDQKNDYLSLRRGAISLAYSATERGLYNAREFIEKCKVLENQARTNRVFFVMAIKNYCNRYVDFQELASSPDGALLLDPVSPDPRNPGMKCWIGGHHLPPQPFVSSTTPPTAPPTSLAKDSIVLNYPVGIECQGDKPHRGLGVLNLAVWRQVPGRT